MMATKTAMLLSIWDLDQEDETIINELLSSSVVSWNISSSHSIPNDGSTSTVNQYEHLTTAASNDFYDEDSSHISYEPVDCSFVKYCSNCCKANEDNISWCIECGTCFSLVNHKAEENDEQSWYHEEEEKEMRWKDEVKSQEKEVLQDQKKNNIHLLYFDEKMTQKSYRSSRLVLEEETEICPNDLTPNNNANLLTRLSPHKYTRKWRNSSSSLYMWQKPSSLKTTTSPNKKEPSKEDCFVVEHKKSLLDLPDELILFILSLLSLTDLTTCSYVCKRLYRVTFDPTLYGREITLDNTMTIDMFWKAVSIMPSSLKLKKWSCCFTVSEIDKAFTVLGTKLKKLVLDTCHFRCSSIIFVILTAIAQHCPRLISLELHWINIDIYSLIKLIENCTKLEELKLIDVSGIAPKCWIKIVTYLSGLLNLKVLHIALYPELPLSVFLTHQYSFPSLKTLTVRQYRNTVSLEDIQTLLNITAPNIKSLQLECFELCSEIKEYLTDKEISFKVH